MNAKDTDTTSCNQRQKGVVKKSDAGLEFNTLLDGEVWSYFGSEHGLYVRTKRETWRYAARGLLFRSARGEK